MYCAKFGWNWLSIFFILSIYFPIFGIISPWKWVWSFIWTNLNPLHPRCFVLSLVVPVVLEKKMKIEKFTDRRHAIKKAHWAVSLGELKRLHKYTEAFNWQIHANEWNAIIYPWKRAWPSNWTKLNFLNLRNWTSCSGEEYENMKSLGERNFIFSFTFFLMKILGRRRCKKK